MILRKLILILLYIHRFIHAIVHILNNWFSKKEIFRQKLAIDTISLFFLLRNTCVLHFESWASLDWEYTKNSSTTQEVYSNIGMGSLQKNHILIYKGTINFFDTNWKKDICIIIRWTNINHSLIKFHTMKHILLFVILLLQCYWVAKTISSLTSFYLENYISVFENNFV